VVWDVLIHPAAEKELNELPVREKLAVDTAIDKLRAIGAALQYPHSSNVQTANNVRELRPRQGRSPWRAFYGRIGDVFVVAAVGPEAQCDPRGFRRSVDQAEERLDELEDDE
jgi:hypothetical protein